MARVKIWAQSDYFFRNYSYLREATVANFQNNGKILISYVDKALLSDRKKNSVQAKHGLNNCYSDAAPSKTTIKRWHADFKHGRTDTKDAERSGRTNSAVVLENNKNSFCPIVNWSCAR